GCSLTPDTTPPPLDLDVKIDGAETTVERYAQGCKAGGSAELWSIQGGTHLPEIAATFREDVIDFLLTHPKPWYPRRAMPRAAPTLALGVAVTVAPLGALAWTPVPTEYDPLIRMPGTQPDPMITIQPATGCLDCHYGYAPPVAPGFGWRGSNMAQ